MSNKTTISLPWERHAQLVELRDMHNFDTLSHLIRDLIAVYREQHKLPHRIPGVKIQLFTDGLLISADGKRVGVSIERAKSFAQAIRGFLSENGLRQADYSSPASEFDYSVAGKGRGVIIRIGEFERVVTPDVAEELADLIEQALVE